MTYYVVSDIHGYYDVLIESLHKSGYDSTNKSHHLIVVGDMFDRGEESDKVLEYLYNLYIQKKATIILGNHDSFLLDLFDKKYLNCLFNIKHNGFDKTLKVLSGLTFCDVDRLHIVRDAIIHNYPYLESFIRELPYYYELDDYIFVHGGVDGSLDNWKDTPKKRMVWNYQVKLDRVPQKTIVAGHHRVATIRHPKENYKALFTKQPEAFDIYRAPGKILIDRYVEVSKELNVLVIKK